MISADAARTIERLLATILRTSELELRFEMTHPTGTAGESLRVEFDGRDVPFLLARNAELLLALEHAAVRAIRLTPEEHDQVSFDAGGFKQRRDHQIERMARIAADEVRSSGRPYRFAPMNSRERRLLHLALTPYGFETRSEGEGATRHLVLHPSPATRK